MFRSVSGEGLSTHAPHVAMAHEVRLVPSINTNMSTENGSIDGDIIKAAVNHVNSFIREHVSPHKAVVLVLDGHASRNSMEWLQYSAENNLEIVRLPANTSHFYNSATKRLTVFSSDRIALCMMS